MSNPVHLFGKVYILENVAAKLLKVGMTTSSVEERLIDINQMWLGTKATCQICGGRRKVKRIKFHSFIPDHIVSGTSCPGGRSLPLEEDSSIAKEYLKNLEINQKDLSGDEAASNTRKINNLKERIKRFEYSQKSKGIWRINTIYYTEKAEEVELKAHKVLSDFLDIYMPFGEVFNCSIERAQDAIFSVLKTEGLTSSVRIETNSDLDSPSS